MTTKTSESLRETPQVSATIASLRRLSGESLEQLAARSGLTKSYLSKLERGVSAPSINSVSRLAEAFDVGVAELLGETVSKTGFRVVRRDEQSVLSSDGTEPLTSLILQQSSESASKLGAYILNPPPWSSQSEGRSQKSSHMGEEFIYVLKGRVRLVVADRVVELKAGDSAWYRANLVHQLSALGTRQSSVLVVTGGDTSTMTGGLPYTRT